MDGDGWSVECEAGPNRLTSTPMVNYRGALVAKRNRQAPVCDYDLTPRQLRHYVDPSGANNIQIHNGLRWGVGNGRRRGYRGSGYLYGVMPIIPGQTRGDVSGFHKRGPSPLNVQAMWEAGPGSQPANPGGPGKIAAPLFVNPMSG